MIDQALLAESLGRLDAGTRALLDLSLRRAIPDDQVAKVLGVDAASIPPRRARGIAQLADMMEVPGPSELAALLIAIPDLPEEAWGVPAPVPFEGGISRARRAKAFRRVAIAASPLVALGAVMAAVLVSTDHSGGGPGSGGTQRGAGGAGAGAGPAATALAPDTRHRLPSGVRLTAQPHVAQTAHRHAAHHHRARHGSGTGEPAILTRAPVEAKPRTVPVAFHPAPVQQEPRHVTHHHAPSKPQVPTSTPAPAPVQTPSQPVSSPAPTTPASPPTQVSAPETHTVTPPTPVEPTKTPPPQPVLTPPSGREGGDDDGGDDGGCSYRSGDEGSSDDQGSSHDSSHPDEQGREAKSFTPPGLFRKRY